MPVFRVCKRFTIESGHMLSRHPGRCRFPHGHTRTVEVVVASDHLDEDGMVVDFKALKLAVSSHIRHLDHAMAIHASDPLLPELLRLYPESVVVFEDKDPTTEVIAHSLYETISEVLASGVELNDGEPDGHHISYSIPGGILRLERLRVWETPTSWAEVAAGP